MSGRAVIAIHGILNSSRVFAAMTPALEQAGYTVVGFDYPEARGSRSVPPLPTSSR